MQSSMLETDCIQKGNNHRGPIHSVLCANNGDVLRDMAILGYGITQLPTFLVGPDIATGQLSFCPNTHPQIWPFMPFMHRAGTELQKRGCSLIFLPNALVIPPSGIDHVPHRNAIRRNPRHHCCCRFFFSFWTPRRFPALVGSHYHHMWRSCPIEEGYSRIFRTSRSLLVEAR